MHVDNSRVARDPAPIPETARRRTQAERRERSRNALLEAASRGISRYGYTNVRLEDVARDAGYSRGALYHQFEDKEDLVLAAIDWVDEAWAREVGEPARRQADAVGELIALARGHAIFCRRDIARVAMALRIEFSGRDHAIAHKLESLSAGAVKRVARLINQARKNGSLPAGPPAKTVARAFLGALEGTVIELAGEAPQDELLAVRAVAGVLGLARLPAEQPR